MAAAIELAFHHGVPITPASIAAGIRNTRWPARLEVIQLRSSGELAPPQVAQWVLDVAHNPAGAWALRAALRSILDLDGPDAPPPTLIFSCLRDKPIAEMAQILFPIFDRVIFAPIDSPRATPMADLLAAAASTGTPATAASSVTEAIELATDASNDSDKFARPARTTASTAPRLVVAGSVYLVGEARALLLARAGVPA
jgi:dihydrofolate synthase/folylpolyglutamate synthase